MESRSSGIHFDFSVPQPLEKRALRLGLRAPALSCAEGHVEDVKGVEEGALDKAHVGVEAAGDELRVVDLCAELGVALRGLGFRV